MTLRAGSLRSTGKISFGSLIMMTGLARPWGPDAMNEDASSVALDSSILMRKPARVRDLSGRPKLPLCSKCEFLDTHARRRQQKCEYSCTAASPVVSLYLLLTTNACHDSQQTDSDPLRLRL